MLALGLLLAGCGTKATLQTRQQRLNETALTVYSSLPLLGDDRAAMQEIVNGEALALYDAGGRVRFGTGKRAPELHISLESLNDADPKLASWTQERDRERGQGRLRRTGPRRPTSATSTPARPGTRCR